MTATAAQQDPSTSAGDQFGSLGVALTAYHVGDLTGIVGLVLTLAGLWLTFREARKSRAAAQNAELAAKQAAAVAVRHRDSLELAGDLATLANGLVSLRDIYRSDDWAGLDHWTDRTVALAVEVRATATNEEEVIALMEKIQVTLRDATHGIEGLKDPARIMKQKRRLASEVSALGDEVQWVRLRKVKHGT